MSNLGITDKAIRRLQPANQPYFLRDATLRGFAVKVNPSGSIRYIAEVRHNGQTFRKTIGSYGIMDLQQAKTKTAEFILRIRSNQHCPKSQKESLRALLKNYISGVRLKPRTVTDYEEAIGFYLADWLSKPVDSISKSMVEQRFAQIRDKGINGGKPTYSQATKTMRILSALMNYAIADELIESNPVDILKQKRIDRSTRKRDHYLPTLKVRELLDKTAEDNHPVTLAVKLMLHTGLRKNEALRLKWDDLDEVHGIPCVIVGNTKNNRPHYLPITEQVQSILDKAQNDSIYVFQSTQRKGFCVNDVRHALKRMATLIDMEFRCHDLRRTFATRAAEVGIDYLMIKRMLNHCSGDITAQYIQWNSKQNLVVMHDALRQVQY